MRDYDENNPIRTAFFWVLRLGVIGGILSWLYEQIMFLIEGF